MADSECCPNRRIHFSFSLPFRPPECQTRPIGAVPRSRSITNDCPSPDLRSHDPSAEKVLGDKAVGGIDADKDHVPNVISGLKA